MGSHRVASENAGRLIHHIDQENFPVPIRFAQVDRSGERLLREKGSARGIMAANEPEISGQTEARKLRQKDTPFGAIVESRRAQRPISDRRK